MTNKLFYYNVILGNILIDVNFKPIQEIEVDNCKLLFTPKKFYYDTKQLKTRYKIADNHLYLYVLYKNVLWEGWACDREKESIDEAIEMFKSKLKNMPDLNERVEELLKGTQDLTLLTKEELKQFVESQKEKYRIKLENEMKEKQERERQERERQERERQQFLKEKIKDFINNRYISGEVLLNIIREIDYKIPLRTAGSLKALLDVRITEDNNISYYINKGRRLTDNMSSIIRVIIAFF